MQQCIGITTQGVRCSAMVLNGDRCGTHVNTMNKVGPNQIRRNELKYLHMKNHRDILWAHRENLRTLRGLDHDRAHRAFSADLRLEELRYQEAINQLEIIIDRETEANGGVNADQPAIDRARAVRIARRDEVRQRWERNQAFIAEQRARRIPPPLDVGGAQAIRQGGELANLANDRQNIHTTLVVQKVKEMVEKILQILVPPEYQTDTLKTPGEIILECKLSKQAAWQMMAKYCADADIYEMGVDIYPRVLNSVWQYIKASPDAEDLKKILASEMQDNIGMCAQGNLSRLCNILSGYLDGVNAEIKSRNQILGELLAPLIEINNTHERLKQAIRILRDHKVPLDERDAWLESLGEDDEIEAAHQAVAIDV